MATLALGVGGAFLGSFFGPFGAQLGFLAGSALGSALFPQKGPPPPVQDLKFSGASYGNPRPNAYGKMRVAGTYFWGPDKVAHESEQGKGGMEPSPITTYTASFAVGFGEGSSGDLLQLWFDTTLVYDATTVDAPVADPSLLQILRIYNGAEDQRPDPVMQAINGADVTPAYRGERYITVENLDLTPYGGRWPNVSAVWAPTVEAFPWRVVAHHAGGMDDIAMNPVVPYLYAGWGGLYEEDETTFIMDAAIAVSREANPIVSPMPMVPQNAGSFMSPKDDGSGFWFSWEDYAYGQPKGSFYDPLGAPISNVNHFPFGGPSSQECGGTSVPYDGYKWGSIWENAVETPNGILVALRVGGTLEAWVKRAPARAAWVTDPGFNSIGQASALTYNPTPTLTVGHVDGWSDSCTPSTQSIHPYTVYFVMQHDPTGPETTRPMIVAIGDDGSQHTVIPSKPIFDQDGNNNIEVSSAFWDLALNRLYVTGTDLLELDPETLDIKSYDLVKSDGSHVLAYSNILRDVGFATNHTSNYQSQRFTNGRFWTAKAIWIDLDALRPRLDANDNVVYGDAIIEDHSDAPWFTGCLHAAMAYDPLMDCFYSKLAGQRKIYQLFLHRRMESGSVLTLGELVTMISERVGLTAADLDVTQLTQTVNGFLLPQPTTGRAAIEQLMAAYGFDAVESDGKIKFVKRGGPSVRTIPQGELAAHMAGANSPPPYELARALEEDLPREVNVQYYNLAAAYQQGSQRWRRIATSSVNVASFNVGCAFTDDEAKQIAERLGWLDWLARTSFRFQLPRKHADLEPTDVITIGNSAFTVRLTKTNFDQAVLDCEATLEDAATYPTFGKGSAAPAPGTGPKITSPAQLVVLDVPSLREADNTNGIYLAASSFLQTGWTGAVVFRDNAQIMVMMNEAVIGAAATVLGAWSGVDMFDETNSVDVTLTHAGMQLFNATEATVLNGTNWAVLGGTGTSGSAAVSGQSSGPYPGPYLDITAISTDDMKWVLQQLPNTVARLAPNGGFTGDQATLNSMVNYAWGQGGSAQGADTQPGVIPPNFNHSGYPLYTPSAAIDNFVASYNAWLAGGAVVYQGSAVTGEIFGFKNATLLSPGKYRLSGLLRGRKGTEWAGGVTHPHSVGERFVMLDENALRWVPSALSDVGVQHVYKAVSIGSTQSISQQIATFANSLRPFCPVLSQAVKMPNGDFHISWVPRAIHNHEWMPGIDVPPDAAFSHYEIQIWNAGLTAVLRTITVAGSPFNQSTTYTAALQTTDFGAPPATINFTVGQVNSNWNFGTRRIARYPNTANPVYI